MRKSGYVAVLGVVGIAATVVLHSELGLVGTVLLGAYAGSALLLGVVFNAGRRRQGRRAAAMARLAAVGLAGTGTVTGLELTRGEIPKGRIWLNVALPGRPVYQATVTETVSQTAMPRYQPGCVFPVRVDPDDLAAVTIVAVAETGYLSDPEVLASGLAATGTVTGGV